MRHDAFQAEIERLTAGIAALRSVYRLIHKGHEMGIDRLTEKLERAGGAMGRQSAKIEARCDSIIAREEKIESRTDEVFTPHEAMLSTAEKGLDGLEAKLRLLSNDPLESSSGSQPAEVTGTTTVEVPFRTPGAGNSAAGGA